MAERILVIGSGGREHALCWHLQKKGYEVFAAPGSDAIAKVAQCIPFLNFESLAQKISELKISETIVGPEKYLDEGLADFLTAKGISVFGPTKSATRLESDKSFSKSFCEKYGIPSARYRSISDPQKLSAEIKNFKAPYVVKAAGLAAGKGVWIGDDANEAVRIAEGFLKTHSSVVIEDFLQGEEISYFLLIDGQNICFFGAAQDHKRLLDNDRGPNTGGMGAYSPVPLLTAALEDKISKDIVSKILVGLQKENFQYRGFLFLGLMVVEGEPSVLEFNCRMGDPETQSLMMRLDSPLPALIQNLKKSSTTAQFLQGVSMNVVVAAKGYPENPQKDFELPSLDTHSSDLQIFHSGTSWNGKEWMAKGGRLFSVATLKPNLLEAQSSVYPFIESLKFLDRVSFRKDIGVRAFSHLIKEKRIHAAS